VNKYIIKPVISGKPITGLELFISTRHRVIDQTTEPGDNPQASFFNKTSIFYLVSYI